MQSGFEKRSTAMDEFGDVLNRVLSDPAEMAKLQGIAASLFGEGGNAPPTAPDSGEAPALTERLKGLLGGMGGSAGGDRDKAALCRALSPWLREDRRIRLQKALRLAQAAHTAKLMLGQLGGEGGGL